MCKQTYSCLLPWEAKMPSEPLVLENRKARVGREGTSWRILRKRVGGCGVAHAQMSSGHLWNIALMALQGHKFCDQAVHTGLLCSWKAGAF